jgi:hypothetical protein
MHHTIDRDIMDASNDTLKTVSICPPDIYGESSTIGNHTTYMVPLYVAALLKHKEAFHLGAGENIRAVTHIDDVVDLFIMILEAALEGGGNVQWGKEVCLLGFHGGPTDCALGLLLRGRGRNCLERCRRSHKQAGPGARLVAQRHQNSFVEQRTSGLSEPEVAQRSMLYVGIQQPC